MMNLSQANNSDTALSFRLHERILLVDDDPVHRTCLKDFLALRGYQCLEAGNGEDALDILHHHTISIIITDNHMPEMNGLELIEQVNQRFPHELIPFFLITAELSDAVRLRAFKNGVHRVFEKPLDFKEFCQAIDWVAKFDLNPALPPKLSSS